MNKLISLLIAIFFVTGMSSCVKENFDNPPFGGTDPNVVVNFSIDSVKARYLNTGVNYQFTEDKIIEGVVTADDKSGNFYKQIVIQDSTGGIVVLLEATSLYTSYPIGRRVAIKLKGLWVVAYKNLIQIAGSIAADGSFNGISSPLLDKYLLKGSYYHTVVPDTFSITQLSPYNPSLQNRLIYLKKVEFQLADAAKPFADAFNKFSLTRVVKDCSGHTLDTYNSGFSNFANQLTPSGNGDMTCIYSVYGSNAQLLLRDPALDLHFDGVRCGGGTVSGTGLMAIRNLYAGSDVTLPVGTIARGIVISDRAFGNTDTKNLIIQDSTGGIVVRFSGAHSFNVGDEVSVNVGGLTLKSYSGLLEIDKSTSPYGVPLANATVVGSGTVTPRVATIDQVQNNGSAWESTLLKINAATLSGGSTYSGNLTLTDATGTLTHRTLTAASFATTAIPSGQKSFTGVLGNFTSGYQLSIRSLSDVQ